MGRDTFRDFVMDQLSGLKELSCRPMFGGYGLYLGRVFFGILHKGRLYFRTDETTRKEYAAAGSAPFRPKPGQTLGSYYEVPASLLEDPERLVAWARQAARPTGAGRRPAAAPFEFHPATPERWRDIEKLFGERGACAGCWCMWWRLPRSEWEKSKGEVNRRSFRRIVRRGDPPGLLAYAGGEPAGWIAMAPRADYPALARSRVLAPLDEKPVWSVVCFFVARPFRRRGLSVKLLQAAAAEARRRGARILEGYPVEPSRGALPDAFAWTGIASAFRKAGFTVAARRSATRPIMRRLLSGGR